MKAFLAAAAALAALPAPGPASDGRDEGTSCPAERRLQNEASARVVFEEILSRGRIAENEHVYHPEFVVHGATRDMNRAEDRAASQGWRSLAPDLNVAVVHLLADCSHVAVHWLATGTATGTGNGLSASGSRVRLRGMTFFRMADGRIIEEWSTWDNQALTRQLTGGNAGRPEAP